MKLFDEFEAVKFPEENMIFITKGGYLYYIYKPKYKIWEKYKHAGYEEITVNNYQNITEKELTEAMGGRFPEKETDFVRLCTPYQLSVMNMMDLLDEDYSCYMSDNRIGCATLSLLRESNDRGNAFVRIKRVFDESSELGYDNGQVFELIKELCFKLFGRDIFKEKIRIDDGNNSSSYFYIVPVRIIDYKDTNDSDNIFVSNVGISIEEDDVGSFLMPFLRKYFDEEMKANKNRVENWWTEDDGTDVVTYIKGFEWYLTPNYFTFESMENVIKDISDTIDAISSGKENEFTAKILKEISFRDGYKDSGKELVIDFYRRFILRMEYMMKVGKENHCDLISFAGP